jgi:precorrin-4/cobalt-precorrin-4 C11-methyltransferase
MKMKVVFVGAGPGDPELLTIKGKREIESADVIIYAGSLIHKDVLKYAKGDAILIDSHGKTREEIFAIYERFVKEGKKVVRLHSGDLSFYSAILEQMEFLASKNIEFETVPGVSSYSAASSALKREFTSPGISQTLIITRPFGKTGKPAGESIQELSKHGATMVIFLGVHLIEDVVSELRVGYPPETPVAVVHKASWKDEKILRGTLEDITEKVRNAGVKSQSVIIVGDVLEKSGISILYSGGEKNHEITQHFFFLEKRKPVLKEKLKGGF